MLKINNIKSIHLEVTSKCQARCPMCPRRIHGGPINPFISLNEITLEQFKKWFSVDFINQLNHLSMCGNLGDPIVAQDTLEIYQYLRLTNPSMSLTMNTNGSARSTKWWQELALLDVKVTFGIDGLEDTHQLYRINTDWNKIIENAKSFIDAGGYAIWEMILFRHNEHQEAECEELSIKLGFKEFKSKNTSRFKDGQFIVIDDLGRSTHTLLPTSKSHSMIPLMRLADNEDMPVITCKSKRDNQIYVGSNGSVSPCCWLNFDWVPPMQDNRIQYMDVLGEFPNLNSQTLIEIFESGYFDRIEQSWSTCGVSECSAQCGSFDKMGEQYAT